MYEKIAIFETATVESFPKMKILQTSLAHHLNTVNFYYVLQKGTLVGKQRTCFVSAWALSFLL